MALDLTRPVQTRDGKPVRILATDLKSVCSVVGTYLSEDGQRECVATWTPDGRFTATQVGTSRHDLVNGPRKKTVYLNVYARGESSFVGVARETRADADLFPSHLRRARVACVEVEIAC